MVNIYTEYLSRSDIKKLAIFYTKFNHLSSEIQSNFNEFVHVSFKFVPDLIQKKSNSVLIRPKKIKFDPNSTQKNQIRSMSVFIILIYFLYQSTSYNLQRHKNLKVQFKDDRMITKIVLKKIV